MQTLPAACDVRILDATLDPWPLPAAIVRHGRPEAEGLVLAKSEDGCIVRGIWASSPGTFQWDWSYDETVVVVSGRATVAFPDGRTIELVPGSLAFFERGLSAVWTIHEPFRKGFHALSPTPLPF